MSHMLGFVFAAVCFCIFNVLPNDCVVSAELHVWVHVALELATTVVLIEAWFSAAAGEYCSQDKYKSHVELSL